jgi:hypothetical protein
MFFPTGRATLIVLSLATACIVVLSTGCSGRPKNVARKVTGKVTLGGQPLAGAQIIFTPKEGGSPSMGKTDESGNYTMVWAQDRGRKIEGAQIGEHFVKISTFVEGAPGAKPPRQEVPEKVPFKYRAESPPTATVKAGANTIDFDLEPGPVDPPQPKGKGKAKAKGK